MSMGFVAREGGPFAGMSVYWHGSVWCILVQKLRKEGRESAKI